MVGVVLVLLVIFVVGPVGLFVVGAAWSALTGWLMSADADARRERFAQLTTAGGLPPAGYRSRGGVAPGQRD